MEALKFTVIKNQAQYDRYCNILEDLISQDKNQDEIDLLTLLIEKWDADHNTLKDFAPIDLLKALMDEHSLKAKDLVDVLGLSKGTVSKILNCHKGLSKETIRKLADFFKVSQEAFNRPYKLKNKESESFHSI